MFCPWSCKLGIQTIWMFCIFSFSIKHVATKVMILNAFFWISTSDFTKHRKPIAQVPLLTYAKRSSMSTLVNFLLQLQVFFFLNYCLFFQGNLADKSPGTFLHFMDGTWCKPVSTDYGA